MDYQKKHSRELERTFIARFSLTLEPEGIAEVPEGCSTDSPWMNMMNI